MGRVKLEIKKLENSGGRQTTYSKRKNGILKKAHELSVLCDVDLALIMFSPSGKPSFCFGKHSIEEVIARLNQLPPQERTKRMLEGLEALKKTFKKLDHDVNVQHFLGSSTSTIKVCIMHGLQDLADQGARTKTRLAQIHERLGFWTNPDRINDLELVMQMEDSLEKSLEQIRRQKEIFQKEQRVSLERTQLPIQSSDEQQLQQLQQLQHLYWPPSDDIQHVVLPQEPKLPAQREMESCTGSTSGSYFGCHSTSSKSEDNSPGQLSGIDNVAQGLQNPYLPHGVYMQGDHNLQAVLGMDQRLSTLNYHAHAGVNNYQPTVTWHDICNRFQPESPAESALGDYFNYQKLMTVPGPTIPSIYETIARDPSHILLDTTPNHFA